MVREWIAAGVRGTSNPGEEEITIAPDTSVREQLAIGHELLELHLDRRTPGPWERLCQRGAAALLVPAIPFLQALIPAGLNLILLRRAFPCASAEVLGNRVVDLCKGAAFTVLDPEEGYRRAREDGIEVAEAERKVASAMQRGAWYAVSSTRGTTAQAWRSKVRPQRAIMLAVACPPIGPSTPSRYRTGPKS